MRIQGHERWFVFALPAFLLSACIAPHSVDGRYCAPAPQQQYALLIDGVQMGRATSVSIQGNQAVIHGGLITNASYIKDWGDYNQTQPLVLEHHDFELDRTDASGNAIGTPVQLIDTNLVNVDGEPAADNAGCLLFDSITLTVSQVRGSP